MLTEAGCFDRRRRLWEVVPSTVDWLLIADPRHVHYLCNFWVEPLSFSAGERGFLLIERSGRATLFADNFTIRSAVHAPYIDREINRTWYDHKHSVINRDHALLNAVRDVAKDLELSRGLAEAEWLPMGASEALPSGSYSYAANEEADQPPISDLGTILRNLRRSKHEDEIELLKECMRAGEAGQARLLEIVREGIAELDIYLEVQRTAIAHVGRPIPVYGDFRAVNAEEPKAGGLPKNGGRKLNTGDLFILDYSVVIDGYRSDFTNTVSVGQPSAEVSELHQICVAAMTAGEQALKAGVTAKAVHAAVMDPYHAAGRAELFTHHAGHGLGLGHPEAPILVPDSTDTLRTGDVVTLEPGIYVKGIGGMRIEHNYLITENGYERLSNHEIRLT